MDYSMPVSPIFHDHLEFAQIMCIELTMLSNHLILCHPLLLLPLTFPSIRVFSNESALCITWPKYLSFSFSISPSNEYSGLISFRIDWFDLLVLISSIIKEHFLQFQSTYVLNDFFSDDPVIPTEVSHLHLLFSFHHYRWHNLSCHSNLCIQIFSVK